MVEQEAVNFKVLGSNPSRGALKKDHPKRWFFCAHKIGFGGCRISCRVKRDRILWRTSRRAKIFTFNFHLPNGVLNLEIDLYHCKFHVIRVSLKNDCSQKIVFLDTTPS